MLETSRVLLDIQADDLKDATVSASLPAENAFNIWRSAMSNMSQTLPFEVESEAAKAAFFAGIHEHSLQTHEYNKDYPDLDRGDLGWWTVRGISNALEKGEITPIEAARLFPRASERELRWETITHELNLYALDAIAFPPKPSKFEDPIFAAIDRHRAAGIAFPTVDEDLDPEGFETVSDEVNDAYGAVMDETPTTFSGLVALAEYLDEYLSDANDHEKHSNGYSDNTMSGDALRALIIACKELGEDL